MSKKYNLTAIAVASVAMGAAGNVVAKPPGGGGPGPDPAFPTVKELACASVCASPVWLGFSDFVTDEGFFGPFFGEVFPSFGVCATAGEFDGEFGGESFFGAEASWADTIGAGEAGGATQYAGGLEVEVVFEPNCGFGEYIDCGEGNFCWSEGTDLFAARQFEVDFDLASAAEYDCDGEGTCTATWVGDINDFPPLYGAYAAAHDQACADEGGSSVTDGEFIDAPPPGYEDFEVSLKHTAPGKAGRQDHPVVTSDCYDFSLLISDLDGPSQ